MHVTLVVAPSAGWRGECAVMGFIVSYVFPRHYDSIVVNLPNASNRVESPLLQVQTASSIDVHSAGVANFQPNAS